MNSFTYDNYSLNQKDFNNENPLSTSQHKKVFEQVDRKGHSDWDALNVVWHEVKGKTDSIINHIYQFTVNTKTGDLYLDCTKSKIWCKCALFAILEPIILTGKTVFHALLLPAVYEAFKEAQKIKEEEVKGATIDLKTKFFRILGAGGESLVDIVRTPLYAVALTIIGIAGVIIGPLAPKSFLYELRRVAGKVDLALHRGEKHSGTLIFQCFQPLTRVSDLEKFAKFKGCVDEYRRDDMEYDKSLTEAEIGLVNLAASQIDFRRTSRALFNAYHNVPLRLLPENERYVSASYRENETILEETKGLKKQISSFLTRFAC